MACRFSTSTRIIILILLLFTKFFFQIRVTICEECAKKEKKLSHSYTIGMVSTVTGFRNSLTFPWQTQHLPDQLNLHCHKRIHVVVTNLHPQLSINFCYSVYELIAHLGNMKNDRFFWNTILVLVCHPISFSNILLIQHLSHPWNKPKNLWKGWENDENRIKRKCMISFTNQQEFVNCSKQ